MEAALSPEALEALSALYDSLSLQNQHNSEDVYTLPSLAATMVPFGPQLLGVNPEEILSRISHLSDAGLILITANFSALANQYIASLYRKGFSSVVLVFC